MARGSELGARRTEAIGTDDRGPRHGFEGRPDGWHADRSWGPATLDGWHGSDWQPVGADGWHADYAGARRIEVMRMSACAKYTFCACEG